VPQSWSRRLDSQSKILAWWNAYAAQNYTLAGAVDMQPTAPYQAVYHWDNLDTYRPASPLYIAILKKNP
jgi:hypothetical protein